MKDIAELILITAFILSLFFIFSGTPDVWDMWHAKAMGIE
jgi:hypothetical protein